MSKLVIRHDLDQMTLAEQNQYLRDMSEFLGLDPDLNALDLINMPNSNGTGSALVPYARRGTCELLRDKHEIQVDEQWENVVDGSYIVKVKGHNKKGRVEFALGSRNIEGLRGRDRDDAIMTASTRALQRLTMQFTGLGILSESEVVSIHGQPVNPASEAKLSGSPMVIPQAPVNNAPGKPAEPKSYEPAGYGIADPPKLIQDIKADTQVGLPNTVSPATPADSMISVELEAAKEADIKADKPARKPRKPKNTVTFDVEPERVSKASEIVPKAQETPSQPVVCVDCGKPLSEHKMINSVRTCPVPLSVSVTAESVLPSAATAPGETPGFVPPNANEVPGFNPAEHGLPTQEQMSEYRTKIATYTTQLTASVGMTATQRMRAFLAKTNDATAPQNMTVAQWTKTLSWFDEYTKIYGIGGTIACINQILGDK